MSTPVKEVAGLHQTCQYRQRGMCLHRTHRCRQWSCIEHVDAGKRGGSPSNALTPVKEAAVGLRQMRQCWWKRRGWSNCISHVDAGGRGRGGGGVASTTSIAVGMVFTEPRGGTSSMFDMSRGMGARVNVAAAKRHWLGWGQQMSWRGGRKTAKRVLTTRFMTHLIGLPHQGSPLIFHPSLPIRNPICCNVGP